MAAADGIARALEDVERVRARTRGARRPASVPLAVLAGVLLLAAAGHLAIPLGPPPALWAVAVPGAFALVGLAYGEVERRTGVGTERPRYLGLAAILFVALLLPVTAAPMLMPFTQHAIIGLVLLAVAVRLGQPLLALGAIVFGLGGALEAQHVIGNRLPLDGRVGAAAAWLLLALVLGGLALVARRHEDGLGRPA